MLNMLIFCFLLSGFNKQKSSELGAGEFLLFTFTVDMMHLTHLSLVVLD